jgi:hypothetical protein
MPLLPHMAPSVVLSQVRILIIVCSPIAWPISKFLDWILGNEHSALFRRAELKVRVTGPTFNQLRMCLVNVVAVCGPRLRCTNSIQAGGC